MKKKFAKKIFFFYYKSFGLDKRSLLLFTQSVKVLTRYLN